MSEIFYNNIFLVLKSKYVTETALHCDYKNCQIFHTWDLYHWICLIESFFRHFVLALDHFFQKKIVL